MGMSIHKKVHIMQKLFSKQAGDTLKNGGTFRHWCIAGRSGDFAGFRTKVRV